MKSGKEAFRSGYFTTKEKWLWCISVTVITTSFFIFDRVGYLTLAASLTGVTSLIFNAKGNPVGQLLMIVFSLLYGLISWSFSYYGEMITYLGMTAPMALFAMISWLKHPWQGNASQVQVSRLRPGEAGWMLMLTAAVTLVFYWILKAFHTANLPLSTVSVTTSFLAVYLTFRRNPWYAAAYAANDLVLIGLWVMASMSDASYISVVICFIVFLINDLYGFFTWSEMQKQQEKQRDGQTGLIIEEEDKNV